MDLIDRQAAIDALVNETIYTHEELVEYCEKLITGKDLWANGIYDSIKAIEQLPSAQAKRGKWISADAMFGGVPFYCSECGENTRDTVMGKPRWNFCPNCGADMRGEQDG